MSANPEAAQAGIVCRLDHVVIVADNLVQGARWCEQTLGVTPIVGGRHALMATHNLLLKIATPCWPDAYLEIIAIDPLADPSVLGGRSRWFGIDDPLQRQMVEKMPRLVHFVAQTADLRLACSKLAAAGEDVGVMVAASRPTSDGELRWQITLRDDGRPQHRGALPALIEWQGRHPAASMVDSGVQMAGLTARSDQPAALRRAWSAIGLEALELEPASSEPPLELMLHTPRGSVRLSGGFGQACF